MAKNLSIAFILVTYNSSEFIETWIESVSNNIKFSKNDSQIYIIDNGSSDSTYCQLKDLIANKVIPKENVLFTHHNNGFNKAINWVVKEHDIISNHSHIALVNHDAVLEDNWLSRNIEAIKLNSDDCLFASKILDSGDNGLISSLGHSINYINGKTYDVGWRKNHKFTDQFKPCILTPCFAVCVFPASCFREVCFPDNDQWMYYDDILFFLKCLNSGYRTIFVESAIAYHPLPQKTDNLRILLSQEEGRNKLLSYMQEELLGTELYNDIVCKWNTLNSLA